jgi:hypothetical protein
MFRYLRHIGPFLVLLTAFASALAPIARKPDPFYERRAPLALNQPTARAGPDRPYAVILALDRST